MRVLICEILKILLQSDIFKGQIWGNLISSTVFSSHDENVTMDVSPEALSKCGAGFCPGSDVNNTNLERPPIEKVCLVLQYAKLSHCKKKTFVGQDNRNTSIVKDSLNNCYWCFFLMSCGVQLLCFAFAAYGSWLLITGWKLCYNLTKNVGF